MTMVELILSGLLLVSLPEKPGRDVLAVFPSDDNHIFHLVLLKGSLGDGCNDAWTTSADHVPVRRISSVEAKDLALSINGTAGTEMVELVGIVLDEQVPSTVEKSTSFAWVADLSPMVMGRSTLRTPCGEPDKRCPGAPARFFLDRGRFTSCHLAHDVPQHQVLPLEPDKTAVRIYSFPSGRIGALADSISVKQQWGGDRVTLNVGSEECVILADSGVIELFVANASTIDHTTTHPVLTAGGKGAMKSHFPRLHRYSKWFFQRMDRSHPRRQGTLPIEASLIGSCEGQIENAHKAIKAAFPVAAAHAHSPSECGTAQQP